MALAPKLDAANLIGSSKVIAVASLAQPPSLAGGLAGLLASGLGAIALTVCGPWIGEKELRATTAFASALRAAHREPDLEGVPTGRKRKRSK
jgi:hypothetical protein